MMTFRRPALLAAFVLALLPSPSAGQALDPAALAELEALLRDLSFDPGAVDGVVDADTTAAIQRYQDFALLPGPPEPTARLLDELRGVAAAFSALNAGKAEAPPSESQAPAEPLPRELGDKVVVPPPPPPPKLIAEVPEEEEAQEAPQEEMAEEVAEAPAAAPEEPAEEPVAEEPAVEAAPPDEAPLPEEPSVDAAVENAADPEGELKARIDAELLRFRHLLADGRLTRADLARQFNTEGRKLLQQADYDAAILKFSVAIHLDPDFAGAHSNRGTAYQHLKQSELAQADFDKARELGFGGFRTRDAKNPLN